MFDIEVGRNLITALDLIDAEIEKRTDEATQTRSQLDGAERQVVANREHLARVEAILDELRTARTLLGG